MCRAVNILFLNEPNMFVTRYCFHFNSISPSSLAENFNSAFQMRA
jgi:hypothetical protein